MVNSTSETPDSIPPEMHPDEERDIRRALVESLAAATDYAEKRAIVEAAFTAGELGADELEDLLQTLGVSEAVAIKRHEKATRRALGRRADSFRIGGEKWLSL
jgi:hypothetical protein